MSAMNLIQLYLSINVQVYSEWISDVDLSCLDVSVCSNRLRPHFLLSLGKTRISIDRDDGNDALLDKYEWMLSRGIGMSRFTLYFLSPLVETIASRMNNLPHLNWYGTDADVLLHLPIFSLKCVSWDPVLVEKTLTKVCGVTHLDLSQTSKMTISTIGPLIVSLFPNLTVFKAPFCCLDVLESCKDLGEIEIPYSAQAVRIIVGMRNLHSIAFLADSPDHVLNTDLLTIAQTFSNLRKLSFGSSNLLSPGFEEVVSKLPLLTSLECRYFNINNASLVTLASNCRFLKSLLIYSSVNINAGVLVVVEKCQQLKTLSVHGNSSLTESGVESLLMNASRLTSLMVASNFIRSNALSRAFQMCPSLTHLTVDESDFSIQGILSAMSDVESLSVKDGNISFKQSLRQVEPVHLMWPGDVVGREFMDGIGKCRHLKEIKLFRLYYGADAWIETLLKYCPLLTGISIHCTGITYGSIEMIARSSLDLKKLYVFEMHDLSKEILLSLLQSKSGLRSLNLPQCTGYSVDLMLAIADTCSEIESIVLTKPYLHWRDVHGRNATDEVCYLIKNCEKLRYLRVGGSMKKENILLAIEEASKRTSICEVTDQGCTIKFTSQVY